MGSTKALFAAVLLTAAGFSAPAVAATLTGDTSRPAASTFAIGEQPRLTFSATGLPPNASTTLSLVYRNEYDQVIAKDSIVVNAGTDGKWTGAVSAPASRLGFYRVFASLADGATLGALGSRKGNYLTYAVVPDPALRTDYGAADSMFGMQGGFNAAANIIPYLGVRWVNGGWSWSDHERDGAGEFDKRKAEAAAKGDAYPPLSPANEDIEYNGHPYATYVLACMNGAPKWASLPGYESGNSVLSESGEQAWGQYCAEVGKAFPARYPAQPFVPAQLTWEPAYPWNWKGTDAQLVRIYQIAYPAFHKIDSHALVIGPTMGYPDSDLFKAGLGRYLDGFSLHPYQNYPPELMGYANNIRLMKQQLRQYCGREIPIYGTEQGYSTKGDVSKELDQARSNVRDNLISLGEGFACNFAFYVDDYPGEPGYGFFYNLDPAAPWGSDKLSPKPAVPAYAAMTSLIDGHRPAQTIEWLGPTALGYAFQRGDDIVLALWDYSGSPDKVTIPTGTPSVKVYDWMGNVSKVETDAGRQLTVTLTPDPIYIRGVSPRIWGRTALKPLTVDRNRVDAFPGDRIPIDASVADAAAGTGRLVLEPGASLHCAVVAKTVVLSKTPLRATLGLSLPRDIPVGDYSARLTLQRNGTPEAATGVLIHVRSPIQTADIVPAFRDGAPMVSARLTNLTAKPIDADIELRLLDAPGKRPAAHISLAPAQSATAWFDCASLEPTPDRLYDARLTLTTADGYRTSSDFNLNFCPVPWATRPPGLDSSLDNWSTGPEIETAGRQHVIRSPEYYNGKLASAAKFAWDASNLYVAFDVVDPVYIQDHTGFLIWKGDCIQMEFNMDPDTKAAVTGNQAMDKGVIRSSEINVALTANGPEAFRASSFDARQAPIESLDQTEVGLKVVKTAGGLRYRMAIPWKTLGFIGAPSAGQRIGFSAFINDMNQAGQLDPTALGLYADSLSKDPAGFGKLVLLGR